MRRLLALLRGSQAKRVGELTIPEALAWGAALTCAASIGVLAGRLAAAAAPGRRD